MSVEIFFSTAFSRSAHQKHAGRDTLEAREQLAGDFRYVHLADDRAEMERLRKVERAADRLYDFLQTIDHRRALARKVHHALRNREDAHRRRDDDDERSGDRDRPVRRAPPVPLDPADERVDQHRKHEGDHEGNQDRAEEIEHCQRRSSAGQYLWDILFSFHRRRPR